MSGPRLIILLMCFLLSTWQATMAWKIPALTPPAGYTYVRFLTSRYRCVHERSGGIWCCTNVFMQAPFFIEDIRAVFFMISKRFYDDVRLSLTCRGSSCFLQHDIFCQDHRGHTNLRLRWRCVDEGRLFREAREFSRWETWVLPVRLRLQEAALEHAVDSLQLCWWPSRIRFRHEQHFR